MSTFIAKGTRGKQIIQLLNQHGPMSVRGLRAVLEPKIQPRPLRQVLKRLKDCGVIEMHFDGMFSGTGVFYEMAKDLRRGGYVRRPEYLHSEACAVWTERFKRMFPKAVILREDQFVASEVIKKALVLDQNNPENRPDIIILARPENGTRPIMVAVEIERHHKSQERIVQKLKRYARGSRLDGVLYLCPKGTIGRRVRMIYQSRIVDRSHLIKTYGMNFLLIGEGIDGDYRENIVIRNATGNDVSLQEWMQVLQQIPREDRRDTDFCMPSTSGRHFQDQEISNEQLRE